ncbi:MAG: T9SS type A sorting domain-containing protein [Candidatus Poribacteria bacterium]|nr:T9SS type A sorting domain-containing protein [Candidatus Poribacteria bacterium]
MKTRHSHHSACILALILIFITAHARAITTFTINGQTEIEINFEELRTRPDSTSLLVEADVSRPGGVLTFEAYIDTDGNGQLDPQVDSNVLARSEPAEIVDGGEGFPGDQDRTANGQITLEAQLEGFLLGFPTAAIFIRALDEDGSFATVTLHPIIPEFTQSISGRVSSEAGESIAGVVVLAYHQPDFSIPFPGPIDEPFPIPEFFFFPLITSTDADGSYNLPIEAGTITVRVIPKQGYYAPDAANPFDRTAQQTVDLAPNETQTGVDFILAADDIPPTIEHEPPQGAVIVNSAVRLRARITDGGSGVDRFGGSFGARGGMPTLFFRPAGSDLPFRRRAMYPIAIDVPPIPVPLPVPPLEDPPDLGDVGTGTDRGDEAPVGFPDIDLPNIDFPGIDLTFPPINFPQFESYEARLSGADIGGTGVEYYIRASDLAGNSSTHPADAPAILHLIHVQPSEFMISGRIHTPDDTGVAGVTVFAHAFTRDDREFHGTQTESLADGTYVLHLPTGGRWEVFIVPHHQFVILEPQPSQVVVEITEPGASDGNDFVVVNDQEPPVIDHDPTRDVTASSIGEDVIIRAKIEDNFGRVRAHLVILPVDGERGRFLPHAISSVENGTDWTFRILGELIQSDFAYFIQAYDQVGNRATHPAENPEENPHRVTLLPSPYRIVGTVTDTDGNPVPEARITFSSEDPRPLERPIRPIPGIRFREGETGADGRFSVPVTRGVWEVSVFHRGFALSEPIEPIRIEDEGDYELSIVLAADSELPVIVHQPAEGYTFGEPMIVQAEVTDNHRVRAVYLRLFREFGDDVVIFEEGGIAVESPKIFEDGDTIAIETPAPVPPVADEEGETVEPGIPVIIEPPLPRDIDFPIPLEPTRPGYFELIPMQSSDSTTYSVDLRHYLHGPFATEINAISYVIQAIDVAGLQALSPENAPAEPGEGPLPVEVMHTVPLIMPQTISGTVTVDGEPLPGANIHLTDRETVRLFTNTDAEGVYRLPAVVGKNFVSVGFSFGYEVVFPADRMHQVEVESGQHIEEIDFQLKPGRFEPPILEDGLGTAEPVPRNKEDVNHDDSIDIFDLVEISRNFGKQIDADVAEVTLSVNLDVNDDGSVDIFDLVSVARRFGERLSEAAPALPIQTVDAKVTASPLVRGRSTARIALTLETDVDVFGVQFDLALQSDRVKLIAVEKGSLLGSAAHQSFWRKPDIQGNLATHAANVALLSPKTEASHTAGQVAIVTLQLDGATYKDSFVLIIDKLILVDAEGRGVLAQTQPIHLDAETLLRPDSDLLLQNYPNPFNPETWIPYQISKDASVQIEIYNTLGQAVRTLDLGHHAAGIYVSRGRAAYWDGTNNFGERVASGVYFYAIQTEDYHAVKRMVILK